MSIIIDLKSYMAKILDVHKSEQKPTRGDNSMCQLEHIVQQYVFQNNTVFWQVLSF